MQEDEDALALVQSCSAPYAVFDVAITTGSLPSTIDAPKVPTSFLLAATYLPATNLPAGATFSILGPCWSIRLREWNSVLIAELLLWYDESSGVDEIGMYSCTPSFEAAIQLEDCMRSLRSARSSAADIAPCLRSRRAPCSERAAPWHTKKLNAAAT